jgi:hypothetical protein
MISRSKPIIPNEQWTVNWNDTGPDTWGSGSAKESSDSQNSYSSTCGNNSSSGSGTEEISWPDGTEVTDDGGSLSTNYGVNPDTIVESVHCQTAASSQLNLQTGEVDEQGYGCLVGPLLSSSLQEKFHCQRSEDAAWILETGGKGVPGQENLWQISGSASDIPISADTLYGYPWAYYKYGLPTTPIPSQDITIMGQLLDASGNIYVTLPIGVTIDVTPVALGHDFYTVGVGANPYNLYITANGVQLDPSQVVNGADYCVGQPITFDVTPLPGGYANKAVWSLPGTFVNEQPDPNCNLYYDENSALLQPYVPVRGQGTLSTSGWYVSKELPGTVSVQVGWSDTQNGKIWTAKVTGQFNMHRPTTAQGQPYQPDGTPTAQVLGNILSLGDGNRHFDMSFQHEINPGNFSGQAGYVQLISGEYTLSSTGLPIPIAPNGGAGTPDIELDNMYGEFPRGQPPIPANANTLVTFWDGPWDGLHQGNAKEDLTFSTYLMFRPSGGIWVPLRLVTWTLNDEADNYVLVKGSVTGPNDSDCTTFPHWENKWSGP